MFIVNMKDVVGACTIVEGTKIIIEASTLGLRPGQWPSFISIVRDMADGSQEGMLFGPSKTPIEDSGGFIYWSKGSKLSLHVLND